jgi:CTP:molybdopterin cytidylyltransferase MocA
VVNRRLAAVVLAAGGGSRFAGPEHKLLVPFRGRPVVTWAAESAVAAAIGPTIVVTGAVALGGLLPSGVVVVDNPHWAEGQATSLAAAVDWAEDEGMDAIVVGLGDQPLVPPGAWRAVARAAVDARHPIVVASYGGMRGNPVRLGRTVWPRLPRSGDEGARAVMRERPDLVAEVPCDGEAVDIDTREDLLRWS